MRKSIVIGNWKMNGTRAGSEALLRDVVRLGAGGSASQIGVCVPYLFIPMAQQLLEGGGILFGSQNVADHVVGAFTGEISAEMLREFGCSLAIVGHSERRSLYSESDALVAERYKQAVSTGLTPVLCVGETLDQRENGETFDVVDAQLRTVLDAAGVESLDQAIIAYEPVWAIGTGKTATTAQAQEVHAHIRKQIAALDPVRANAVRILYGGSVKPDNAADLFSMADIDGGLIGGASLDAQAFIAICNAS